ncbi:MAG: hypothetical protein HYZ15_03080 [Sphingobacteriales bacterium]|nr:hypothetical protein [Sphingobacteriales bacterium]
MRKQFLFFLLLSSCISSSSQEFGGNPPSLKWKQINTDTARVIFPAGLDSQANRVAAIVHLLAAEKPVSLGDQLKKINIVLQNQTVIPNGYVQLGPFRSEFFLTPDMNNFGQGSISWADQLALHEYRHVQQFNNFNNGVSKAMKILFGEEGFALAINASVPDWFYEGDAVYQETLLSNQGRGRLPLFMNPFPSLWQAGKKYSWMKLRNGSLKDYVPNHYNLGYLLVNYGRVKYGAGFWTDVTRDASAFKSLFYPFQAAIKKYAGVDYKTFCKDAFAYYGRENAGTAPGTGQFIFPVKTNAVTGYYFPYSAGKDSLLYLKTSYRHRAAFYLKDARGEKRIRVRDISMDEQYSYRNGKIVYAAYENHPRWGWKDYSVIRVLDIHTGRQDKLTTRSNYFTPDISGDGSRIAAVQVSTDGKTELHILDAKNGSLLQRIHSAEISLFTDPKFIDENTLVTAVRLRDGKMALATADIPTGATIRLTPPSFNVVGYPSVKDGVIYFTASYEGNDDVFAFQPGDSKIYRVTRGNQGKYFVNAGDDKLTWSRFTAEGYQLQQAAIDRGQWTVVETAVTETLLPKWPLTAGPGELNVAERVSAERKFPVTAYRKGTRLFNFHSWRPYYEDPLFTFSLYGENVLNTLQTELYYLYNQNEKTSAVGFSGIYGAAFPWLSAGTEYTFSRQETIGSRTRTWNQLDSRIGLTLPLRYTSGTTFKNFSLSSFYVLRNEFNRGFFKDSLGNTSFSYLSHALSWSQQVQRAVQHIYPRFAYSLSASFRHAITKVEGNQFHTAASLYVPGLLSTHNLGFNAAFQERDTLGQVSFANRFAYSRGYTGRYFTRMWKVSANYHLPLWCPDWGFGNLLYIQRIRVNLFYDFTKVYSRDKKLTRDQRSTGGELFADTKWWNQYPLTFGIRVSRLLDYDQFDGFKGTLFEFVLPVSILPR